MFGYLFKDMILVYEYFEIQMFFNPCEKAFYIVSDNGFNENENIITVQRIDSENEEYNDIYKTYFGNEEK